MARYEIVTSRTDGRHRVWDRDEDRVASTWEPDQLAAAEADLTKRLRKVRQTAPVPAMLELTSQRSGGSRKESAESPHIVQHSDGYRIWWPEKRLFVGRAGGGACETLVEAQGRLRELLEIQTGKAKPVHQQLGMFAEPAPSAGPLFKLNGPTAKRRTKGNPMGDHLGAPTPPPRRRAAPDADRIGAYFPDDYQPTGPYAQPIAPGRRSAKRNHADEVVRHRGEHSDSSLTAAQIAAYLRADIKDAITAKGLPKIKTTIRSGGSTLHQTVKIRITAAPFAVLNADRVRADAATRFGDSDLPRYTPRASQVLSRLRAMTAEYVQSETHGASDLYNTNCHIDVDFDHDLEVRERDAIRARGAKPNGRGVRGRRGAARETVARFVTAAAR